MKAKDQLDGIILSYFISFVVYSFLPQNAKDFYFKIGHNIHIHHFMYGVFILILVSYFGLHHDEPHERYRISMLYGFGLFLIFDEIHMMLRLQELEKDPLRPLGHIIIGSFLLLLWLKRKFL